MAVNKVIYNGATLVDLTGVTVTADDLAAGVTATGADGKPVVGLLQKVTIDAELSTTSTNPVQNKVITEAIANMGGGSGGGGVSTSEVNTWTAEQIFNDVTIGGLEKREYVMIRGFTHTPTTSFTIWIIPDASAVATLNLADLIAKTSKTSFFKILLGSAGFPNVTLKINVDESCFVIYPKDTRCDGVYCLLSGAIVKENGESSIVAFRIDNFDSNGSEIAP